jgi:hypothetical protein
MHHASVHLCGLDTLPTGSKDPRIEYVCLGGFGWMSSDDKTITDTTEYRPIGGHVAAGID